jgi:DNA-binding transcriptional LysR family regulator
MYLLGIEAFMAIVRTRSLSQAADSIHLTQATISHRLKTLENELGATLIERHRGERTISLTPFGEDFVSLAERLDTLLQELDQLAAGNSRLALTVGAVDSVNVYILPPLYRALTNHKPGVTLEVRTHQSWELYKLVENREIDVGFTLREMYVHNVAVDPLFSEKMTVIRLAAPENQPNQVISPAELDPAGELYLNYGLNFQTWHDRHWDPFCPDRVTVDTVGVKLRLFTHPKQWTIVPFSVANQFLASGRFITQQLKEPPPDRICYLISHRIKRASTIQALEILKAYAHSLIIPSLNHIDSE